jgi:hypothetical protein
VDVATDALTAKIPLPGRPQFLTIDSQAHRAYVTYNNGIIGEQGMIGGLAIVDTSTNQVITIAGPGQGSDSTGAECC